MHLERLDSFDDIRKHARATLITADATDKSFVPLERVAEAVKLHQADLFDLDTNSPPGLLRAIAKLQSSSKVLGMLSVNQKTIYLDPDQTDRQKRFTTAHEIGHFVLPWQEASFHLDDRGTLSPTTKSTFEREANAFAGELMFGAGRFNAHADSDAPGIATPLALAAEYGASAAATLRQYVEHSGRSLALLATGLFEQRHRGSVHIPVFAGQCAISGPFERRYGRLEGMVPSDRIRPEMPLFHLLSQMPAQGVGELAELTLQTARGATRFKLESFSNGRARYMLLFRQTRLSDQQRQLVDGA